MVHNFFTVDHTMFCEWTYTHQLHMFIHGLICTGSTGMPLWCKTPHADIMQYY